MKKISLLFTFCLSFFNLFAQTNNDLLINHFEKMAEISEDELSDFSELLESYWSITENPIDINSDNIDQLAELKLISIFQLENIKQYRKEYGNIQFIEELYEIEGFDSIYIETIKPIICFNKNEKIDLKNIFEYGKNKILFEMNQCLNKKKGFTDIEDSLLFENPNSVYLGSPHRIYFRYNYSYKDKIEAGCVLEKDPGEYIFKKNVNDSIIRLLNNRCYTGFDFFSLHLHVKDIYFIKDLAIGDYKLSFGQGLTMGSGMAFIANGSSLLRRNKKITSSKSSNESYYLRGIASCIEYKNLELCVFYSNKGSDANVISYDSIKNRPLIVSSLQQSGLHRTFNEIMDRKVIRQQLYGLNLSYRNSNFQLGYTLHKTSLNTDLIPTKNIYNSFYFKGKELINQGIDFYYILKKILLYGEVAMSDNKGFAGLIGTTIQPTGYIEFTILYRNYAKNYQCLYSNAFSSGSKTRNEQGWYLSSCISLAANWELIASFDLYKSDWLKNLSYSPSNAYEINSQINYRAKDEILLFWEYRKKNKMHNTNNTNIYQKYLSNENINMLRFHISYKILNDLTFKNRIEYHFNNNDDENYNSYLIYQDINYSPADKQYSIAFRYELFNAEKGSVYAYENDVFYAFAIGSLSGKGIRTYLVSKVKLFKRLQISGKIGFTIYDNKNEISSGLETIENNWKSDGKAQLIWSF